MKKILFLFILLTGLSVGQTFFRTHIFKDSTHYFVPVNENSVRLESPQITGTLTLNGSPFERLWQDSSGTYVPVNYSYGIKGVSSLVTYSGSLDANIGIYLAGNNLTFGNDFGNGIRYNADDAIIYIDIPPTLDAPLLFSNHNGLQGDTIPIEANYIDITSKTGFENTATFNEQVYFNFQTHFEDNLTINADIFTNTVRSRTDTTDLYIIAPEIIFSSDNIDINGAIINGDGYITESGGAKLSDGSLKVTSSGDGIIFGDTTTEGSWRITIVSGNCVIQILKDGSWVTRQTITPAD